MSNSITVFGLGIIGSRCADNLSKAGHKVTTWNRTPKDRADETTDASQAAQASDILSFYLKDGQACREVLNQIRTSLRPDHVIINHSTIDLVTTHWLATECSVVGCQFIDSPFTGSKVAAQNGELVYYVGASDILLEQYRSVLEVTSKEIIPVGKVGNATIIKLVTNLISASTVQALSESMAIASAHGISPDSLISAIAGNACGSPLASMKMPTMNEGNYETHFSLDNMLKDANYAIQLADEAELKTPGIRTTADTMQKLCDAGSADLDYSALFQQFTDKPL